VTFTVSDLECWFGEKAHLKRFENSPNEFIRVKRVTFSSRDIMVTTLYCLVDNLIIRLTFKEGSPTLIRTKTQSFHLGSHTILEEPHLDTPQENFRAIFRELIFCAFTKKMSNQATRNLN